jgi:acetyl esterase/lipase
MSYFSIIAEKAMKKQQDAMSKDMKTLIRHIHAPQNSFPPRSIFQQLDVTTNSIDGRIYYVVKKKNKNITNKAVLYIHGGGFVLEIHHQH